VSPDYWPLFGHAHCPISVKYLSYARLALKVLATVDSDQYGKGEGRGESEGDLRELAMEISLTSFGSSQILR